MPTTPAGFGRAINFGNPAPLPIWRNGDAQLFPNAIGWAGVLQVEEILAELDYSRPVLDMIAAMRTGIAIESPLQTAHSLRSDLKTGISLDSDMPSTRITRDATDY